MTDDTRFQAKKTANTLGLRALELAKKNETRDMSDVLSALSLILRMLENLANEQDSASAKLDRLS